MAKVRDFMTRDVISVKPDTPVDEIAHTFAEKGIHGVPVIDEQGKLVGIISQTDLVNLLSFQDMLSYWKGLKAKHVMTKEVVTISPEASIEEAAQLMSKLRIHRLVVVEGGKVVGIISTTDLMRAMEEGGA